MVSTASVKLPGDALCGWGQTPALETWDLPEYGCFFYLGHWKVKCP